MAGRDAETRRKARAAYIFKRQPGSLIAVQLKISEATFARWKKAAKEGGDDWDMARTANLIAGEGLESVLRVMIDEFVVMAQSVIEEIKTASTITIADKVKAIVSMADAMNKMTVSAGKLAPKISELGVAQDVMRRFLDFVRAEFPQHAAVILEIIEPFGEHLVEAYTT